MVLLLYLYFGFALGERKTEVQTKMKYRCKRSLLSKRVSPVNNAEFF